MYIFMLLSVIWGTGCISIMNKVKGWSELGVVSLITDD